MNENLDNEKILITLNAMWSTLLAVEERIDCIQHTVCKNDDKKTEESIKKFLCSNFRNIK